MAGQQTLNLLILVQIQVPEQKRLLPIFYLRKLPLKGIIGHINHHYERFF